MEMQLFLLLLAGHYLADYGLQTRHMSAAKIKVFIESEGFHVLTAHAFIHGLVAGLLSQDSGIAIIIGISHWIIDFIRSSEWFAGLIGSKNKSEKLFNIHIDQLLHIGFIVIAIIIFQN